MKKELKLKAIELRRKGYSLNEIVGELGVAKSSASEWVRNVPLSKESEERLLTKIKVGQLYSQKANRERRVAKEVASLKRSRMMLKRIPKANELSLLICSLLYFCEGRKSPFRGVDFMNSDPGLMKLFLALLRRSFDLDEDKFRMQIHLHTYHDEESQLSFWSGVTGIPRSQFIKSYIKKTSGMYKKEGYQGCACVSYHDVTISRELRSVASEYMKLNECAGDEGIEPPPKDLEAFVLPLN